MSNILCIDDEPSVGVVLEHHLTEIGHQPTLATSVDEGLRAVREGEFDLIISDYRMPNATGLDLLELLRQQGRDHLQVGCDGLDGSGFLRQVQQICA